MQFPPVYRVIHEGLDKNEVWKPFETLSDRFEIQQNIKQCMLGYSSCIDLQKVIPIHKTAYYTHNPFLKLI